MSQKKDNGQVAVPANTLLITWDQEKQGVGIHFDPQEFRSWNFIGAILEMAKDLAETNRRIQAAQQAQAMAMQQMENRVIAQKVLRG